MESTELEKALRKLDWATRYTLSVKRYTHIERVIEHARDLARRYGVEPLRVAVAAAGHDMARELPPSRLVELADHFGVPQHDPMREHPVLLHGPVAAGLMGERYGVRDREILEAVYHHTLGSPHLEALGKILYVADYTEPGRPYINDELLSYLLVDHLDDTVARVILHARNTFGRLSGRTREFFDSLSTRTGAVW